MYKREKQWKSLWGPKKALPEWEQAITQEFVIGSCTSVQSAVREHSADPEKVCYLSQRLPTWVHNIINISVPSFMTCLYLACVSLFSRIKLCRLLRFAASYGKEERNYH